MPRITVEVRQVEQTPTSEGIARTHRVLIDRPKDNGGLDRGPLGGELLFRVAPSTYFNPNLEFVFKEDSYVTFNMDFHYDFHAGRDTFVWAGAGLAAVSINPPGPAGGHTDAGLNLLFGVGLRRRPVIPYFQAKVIIKDQSELSLGVGLRF